MDNRYNQIHVQLRDEALTRYHRVKTDTAKKYYCSLKNYVTKAIKNEKIAYYNYHINNNFKKPKILWKNLKNTTVLGNTRAESIPDHINDPDKISDYFHTLPSCKSVDFNKDEIKKPTIQNPLDLKLTTEADVIKIINNITTNSSG